MWLDRRLEGVAKAVGGGLCRLQMPLKLALAVRGTRAGRPGRGGGTWTPPPPPGAKWVGQKPNKSVKSASISGPSITFFFFFGQNFLMCVGAVGRLRLPPHPFPPPPRQGYIMPLRPYGTVR